jgi:RNA polymerase subunit RPABC4/transcription elongation factor Spt4
LEEEYQHSLEEEALLQSLEEIPLCPGCSRRTEKDWIVCPHCQTRLKKRCHNCDQIMELPWNLCPYCAAPALGMRRETESVDDNFSPPATGLDEPPAL